MFLFVFRKRENIPDGTKNFVKTFGHSIGTDINGNATNKIIVHTDPNGWVKSAYPF